MRHQEAAGERPRERSTGVRPSRGQLGEGGGRDRESGQPVMQALPPDPEPSKLRIEPDEAVSDLPWIHLDAHIGVTVRGDKRTNEDPTQK